jgi:hypothetical protein
VGRKAVGFGWSRGRESSPHAPRSAARRRETTEEEALRGMTTEEEALRGMTTEEEALF